MSNNNSSGSTDQGRTEECPYLDTINRTTLDFDFEPSCSQSLATTPNIYACLVCGKFFKGRGKQTPAYLHSVNENHSVFLHLTRGTFHCLPDDYEIDDPSLNDIKGAFRPLYTPHDIESLDRRLDLGRDLFGRRYLPGFVGLNNLNKTDCINATLQALAHVKGLRDFFLKCGDGKAFTMELNVATSAASSAKKRKRKQRAIAAATTTTNTRTIRRKKIVTIDPSNFSHLSQCFGDMVRKMWSDKRFKSTVDPHMLVQAISVASHRRYRIGKQIEAGEFIAWFLHQLHSGVGGNRKAGSSIIHQLFQGEVKFQIISHSKNFSSKATIILYLPVGEVEITTRRKVKTVESKRVIDENDDRLGSDDEEQWTSARKEDEERVKRESEVNANAFEEITNNANFLQLTLDIPEKPLFKDDNGGLVIPQEPLVNILKKFDGISFQDALRAQKYAQKRRYRLKQLPQNLILCLSRFKKNSFNNEKNPTIVPFPVKNLDLSRYIQDAQRGNERASLPSESEVRAMTINELKKLLQKYDCLDLASHIVEKSELVEVCINFIQKSLPDLLSHKYDLVANVTHTIPSEVGREGQVDPLEEGSYRCHVQHKATKQWYEIQDLHVQEVMSQLIGVSESSVLIFERKTPEKRIDIL